MKKIEILPKNKRHFFGLIKFCKEIMLICKKAKIMPIAYGGLIYFGYVMDKNIQVKDIDFLIPEKDFKRLIEELKQNKIRYNHVKKWHTLILHRGKYRIEFDSIDFWQKGLPKKFKIFDFDGLIVKAVCLSSLKNIYEKASRVSKDNPLGNAKKFIKLKDLR